jgi:hypothetical protein
MNSFISRLSTPSCYALSIHLCINVLKKEEFLNRKFHLFGQGFLSSADEQHIVEQNDEHLDWFPRFGHLQQALHHDLPVTKPGVLFK